MLTYQVHDAFSGAYRMNIAPRNDRWNTPLRAAGQLQGELNIPDFETGDRIRDNLVPDTTSIYAMWNGKPVWGGIFTGFGRWDPVTKTLPIQADEWRSWFATRLITPNPDTLAVRDPTFIWTSVDQFAIARGLLTYALLNAIDTPNLRFAGDGFPDYSSGLPVTLPVPLSGVVRDASWPSTSFKPVMDAIDELAHRQNGFDWGFSYHVTVNSGAIIPWVELWYPERQSLGASQLFLNWDIAKGGNILSYSPPTTSSQRVSRMWAIGTGTPPDQLLAVQTDPDLQLIGDMEQYRTKLPRVYREAKSTYGTVSVFSTLDSHARTELHDRSNDLSLVGVDAYLDNPDIGSFMVGDRTRLRIRDEWMNVDLPAARIMERSVVGASESDPPRMTLTLDVTDAYGALVEVE